MEKRIRRIEIALVIVALFTASNLIITIYNNVSNKNESESIEVELPKYISKENTDKIIYRIKDGINKEKYTDLYNILNDYAKLKVVQEDVEKDFLKIKNIVGKIETYSYSHYNFKGSDEIRDWYIITYDAKYDYGKGTILLTIVDVDEEWSVAGIKIKLESGRPNSSVEIDLD